MGSGLTGGPLTGGPAAAPSLLPGATGTDLTLTAAITATSFTAPAGTSAILVGPLGAGATDVVTKIGSSAADASVNAAAKLTSFRTGVNGTEVEKAWITKLGSFFAQRAGGALGLGTPDGVNEGLFYNQATGEIGLQNANGASGFFLALGSGASRVSGTLSIDGGLVLFPGSGRLDQSGTDSTGTPGAATINKPTGKSSIAAGAASVLITNSLCAAASRVMITVHARDATCLLIIAVPAAGSFTVSGTANATGNLPFSWEVSNII